jgi:hypothetical protein
MNDHTPAAIGEGSPEIACILCGGVRVREFLDLGGTSLANKFLTDDEVATTETKYPLCVGFCEDCGHVQLTEAVSPPAMFDHYLYISSASTTLVGHLHELARYTTDRFGLGPEHLVVDVGANDGTLLEGFIKCGVRVQGVDPAANLAEISGAKGVPVHIGFFGEKTAQTLKAAHGPARIITATNTFPHLPELADFMRGVDTLLDDEGAFVLEAHYLLDLLEQGAYDTVYHEHVSYWALGPMSQLFNRHGFEIVDVQRLPIHHGQIRVIVRRKGVEKPSSAVAAALAEEHAQGLDRFDTFAAFADRARSMRDLLVDKLTTLHRDGNRIVGYGAPAKGNTLLSFLGIGPDLLPYIADRSTLKQGRYTPGNHIPVVAPERILEEQPEYVLLLAWNFAEEIMEQQAEYRSRGGKFIIPVPDVRIV